MKLMNHAYLTASAVIVSLSLLACADEVKPPKTSASVSRQRDVSSSNTTQRDTKSDHDGSGAIVVESEIARLCALPTTHFAFDSSNILVDTSTALDALVACLSTGALSGRGLNIVGHADPRGELEYNFALGQRRAGSVGAYLTKHGVREDRITTSSRGELDADGIDAASWADDRNVAIFLAAR